MSLRQSNTSSSLKPNASLSLKQNASSSLINSVSDISLYIADCYDHQTGELKDDAKTMRTIRIIQNLNDDLQFLDILNHSQHNKYWFIDLFRDKSNFIFSFETSNKLDFNFYQQIRDDNRNKYYYHHNIRNHTKEDYDEFITNVQHEFNKTLHESSFNTSLTKRMIDPNDYKLNHDEFKHTRVFKNILDLSTSITIIEITVHFAKDQIKINFDILDEGSTPRNNLHSINRHSRNQKNRLSAEDITTLEHVMEFYMKLLYKIIEEELTKLY